MCFWCDPPWPGEGEDEKEQDAKPDAKEKQDQNAKTPGGITPGGVAHDRGTHFEVVTGENGMMACITRKFTRHSCKTMTYITSKTRTWFLATSNDILRGNPAAQASLFLHPGPSVRSNLPGKDLVHNML